MMEEEARTSKIIGPLTFKHNTDTENIVLSSDKIFYPRDKCQCILCDLVFIIPDCLQAMLTHIYMEHRLVIADIDQIASIEEYVAYWKIKFLDEPLAEYCSTMLLDTTPDGRYSKNEKYYLLSDVVPLDNQLRRDLQQKRLERILAHQKVEREDKNYERECLFCRTVIKDTRANFLEHLNEKHNFYIAKTENLIFIGELIEMIATKLDNCVCIYCEKVFKDRIILKEHMRKKVHKRINPKNLAYDKYFISNYLEMGKNWQSYLKNVENHKVSKKSASSGNNSTRSKRSVESGSDSDTNWSDWEEKDSISIICLFCKHSETKYSSIVTHMLEAHNFNFDLVTRKLNFYEKVKIVNYIRRQVHLKKCINCNTDFDEISNLLIHMKIQNHFLLHDSKLWNQPEFYFPTYEDDGFLFCLEDNDDIEEDLTLNDLDISEQVALSVLED